MAFQSQNEAHSDEKPLVRRSCLLLLLVGRAGPSQDPDTPVCGFVAVGTERHLHAPVAAATLGSLA